MYYYFAIMYVECFLKILFLLSWLSLTLLDHEYRVKLMKGPIWGPVILREPWDTGTAPRSAPWTESDWAVHSHHWAPAQGMMLIKAYPASYFCFEGHFFPSPQTLILHTSTILYSLNHSSLIFYSCIQKTLFEQLYTLALCWGLGIWWLAKTYEIYALLDLWAKGKVTIYQMII